TPKQWREPELAEPDVARCRAGLATAGIRVAVSHDSYLINLATPDERLRTRSARAFAGELTRCHALGIPWVVSHPGNYIDDRDAGLERNARGYAACLAAAPDDVGVLIEGTAGEIARASCRVREWTLAPEGRSKSNIGAGGGIHRVEYRGRE